MGLGSMGLGSIGLGGMGLGSMGLRGMGLGTSLSLQLHLSLMLTLGHVNPECLRTLLSGA